MDKFIRFLNAWEGWVTWFLLPALVALLVVDVALRYVFNLPLQWGSDVKELMLIIVVTAGLPATSLIDQHIRVSLFDDYMPAKLRCGWTRLRLFLTGLVAVMIAYALATLAMEMYRFGDRAEMINIPLWPIAAIVAISAALSAISEFIRVFSSQDGEQKWNL